MKSVCPALRFWGKKTVRHHPLFLIMTQLDQNNDSSRDNEERNAYLNEPVWLFPGSLTYTFFLL
jgi:hypothetical protein